MAAAEGPRGEAAAPADPVAVFAARLRELQRESGGPSVRDIENALRTAGKPFSRSTINDKLAGVSKPSWEFVEAFVRLCAGWGPGARRPDRLDEWRRHFQELLVALARHSSQVGPVTTAPVPGEGGPDGGTVRFATDRAPDAVVPRELPPAVAGFVGRGSDLDTVVGLLTTGR